MRDVADRGLATIEPASAYGEVAPLTRRRIKADVIREHWHEVLRRACVKGRAARSARSSGAAALERRTRRGTDRIRPRLACADSVTLPRQGGDPPR